VQREHADLVVFPAVADRLAATSKEHEIRGAVPLFDRVQTFVALMKFAVERFGKLNCVVNNAGAGGEGGPIAGTSIEGFDRSIALLLRGPFLGIKYAVPHMENGTIINIASVAGVAGGYGPHAYTAAKFGVVGLTKSVALELAERGIRLARISRLAEPGCRPISLTPRSGLRAVNRAG
jgi:NAD(P)-dependent dehydrogenase (short-subunit alcohol dehydrogenase family)